MSRLPLCPPPLADETFTSWLVRLAAAHGLGSVTFCNLVAGGQAAFNRDMDGLASERLLVALAGRTGYSPERLREQHTFGGYEGKLFKQIRLATKNDWIFPLGGVTKRLPSLQFCPLCLAADKIPYFRRVWRLSLFAACPVHAVRLRHLCPECGKVVNPLRSHLCYSMGTTPLCWGCGLDLRGVKVDPVEGRDVENARDLQKTLYESVCPARGPLGITPAEYFAALSIVCTRLTTDRPRLRRWREAAAAAACAELPLPVRDRGVRAFDKLFDPADRLAVLRTAGWLLEAWPENFLRVARMANTRTSDFVMCASRHPTWFIKPLQKLLTPVHHAPPPTAGIVRAKRRRDLILAHRTEWSLHRQDRLVRALRRGGFYALGTDDGVILRALRKTIVILRAQTSDYRRRATRQISRNTPEWHKLRRMAVPYRKENCSSAEELQQGIRLLCQQEFLSAYDLSELLGRCQEVLKAKHLTAMVREGWLETRFGPSSSGFRNNPQQAYRSTLQRVVSRSALALTQDKVEALRFNTAETK